MAGSSGGDTLPALEVETLAEPTLDGTVSIEAVLAARKSIRTWTGAPLTSAELGQLLWAMQGITHGENGRTSPSAGAKYPLELFVLTERGVHHYRPQGHQLALLSYEDVRASVPAQDFVKEGPAVFIITAVFARTEEKYGVHAERFIHLEAGHAAHGLVLQAHAMGLGGCTVGGFNGEDLSSLAGLPADHEPVYIIPVGHPA